MNQIIHLTDRCYIDSYVERDRPCLKIENTSLDFQKFQQI